ncbi:hypothetical protein BDW60DRAFT_55142 [Aspergillus nidulans var. acristatus]
MLPAPRAASFSFTWSMGPDRRWLFIIGGLCTVACSLAPFIFLFDFLENTKCPSLVYLSIKWRNLTIKFLLAGFTDAERKLLIRRLEHDGQTDIASHSANPAPISSLQAFLMALADWRLWGLVLTYSMIVGAGTISYYLPTLTGNLGYDSVTAQYMTIPIYLIAVVFSIARAFSDHFQERKYHICVFATVGCIASIVAAIILEARPQHFYRQVTTLPEHNKSQLCSRLGNIQKLRGGKARQKREKFGNPGFWLEPALRHINAVDDRASFPALEAFNE